MTANPSADWTLQQLREVVGDGGGYRYLIHDRDRIFARRLNDSIRALGVEVYVPITRSTHRRQALPRCHVSD